MPEGPESYRDARRIQDAIGGRRMSEVWFAFDALRSWQQPLKGRKLKRARTLGKAILLEFADGTTIYTHNQLYGRWMFSDPDRRPDTNRQLRLALSTTDRSALLYSASEIEVLAPGEVEDHPFVRRAGLDILSTGAGRDDIREWITRKRFARRRLGHLLLDQSFLAGVGNYLRSEILFGAGLAPEARIADLDDAERRALAEAVHDLMWRSVETGGITNDPVRSRKLKEAGWKRREYRHYVFGRDGQACFECDGRIEKTAVDNRRLYFCPRCQAA
jgi:endonuclease-8